MRVVLGAIAAFSLFVSSASAIVIRHDREDRDYRVSESRFPALGSIFRTGEGHRDCVTTLIAPRWVITAAHCTEGEAFQNSIESGARRIELADGRTVLADLLIRHPGGESFDRTPDVALIRLSEEIPDIEPIPLYEGNDERGRVVLMPGWGGFGNGLDGLTEEDGLLRVAENRVEAARDNFLIMSFDDPRSGTGRALHLEGISGPGDSGNPALIGTPQGWRVAGIGSAQRTFGRSEGLYGADEYYVRISDLTDWIHGIVQASDD